MSEQDTPTTNSTKALWLTLRRIEERLERLTVAIQGDLNSDKPGLVTRVRDLESRVGRIEGGSGYLRDRLANIAFSVATAVATAWAVLTYGPHK